MASAPAQARWRARARRHRVEVLLSEGELGRLDAMARAFSASRSGVLRRLLEQGDSLLYPCDNPAGNYQIEGEK